jgi:hypothetical protein
MLHLCAHRVEISTIFLSAALAEQKNTFSDHQSASKITYAHKSFGTTYSKASNSENSEISD